MAIPGLKLQALLALLALDAPHSVSDGRLIDELWGDERLSNAANSLHSQVAILRRTLGREVVPRVGHGYALAMESDDVDAQRFERLVDRSRQFAHEGDHRSAGQGFQTALALVRGPPLGDLVDYPFALTAARRLEQVMLEAHEGFADAELCSGRHAELVEPLIGLVQCHPLREHLHAQLMVALYRCGRQADALRTYRSARQTLVEELGVEPGPELRDLEFAVLSHDPRLAAPANGAPQPPPARGHVSGDLVASRSRRGPMLVGRSTELDQLRSDLADAVSGRGRMALLAGEAGIGKTRLAEELVAEARERGVLAVWGRCHSGRGAPAFWPWTQAIGSIIDHIPSDVVIAALGRGAAEIRRLVPEVSDLVPDRASAPHGDPDCERFRVCDAMTRFICRLAASRPVVIVLDDLHSADTSSLALLSFIAGAVVEAPLFVVGTYRNVGAEHRRLVETLAELTRQPVVRRLDVHGLDQNAVRQLMAAAGQPSEEALVDAVYRRTQGNPFFLVETLRLRSSAGDIPQLDSVPTGVREVIRQRLDQLPTSTVDAMDAASVIGLEIELSMLASILGVDPAGSLQQLEPAFDAGLIVAGTEGPGRLRFSHVLVKDTLYEELSFACRADLHRRAADALESAHGSTEGAHLMALAEHWFHAAPAVDPERGVDLAVRAARWAQQHFAHEQAEEHLRAALVLLGVMPEGRRRAELELKLQYELSVHLIMTKGYATSGVDRVCARMRELCDSIDDDRLLMPALWRLSIFYLFSDDLENAIATGERLRDLGRPTENPAPRFAGSMTLGMLHGHRGDLSLARKYLDLAAASSRAGQSPLVAAFVAETPAVWIAMMSAWNWSLLGEDDRANVAVVEALDCAAAAGESTKPYAMTFATWVASLVAMLRRDVVETRRRCEEGIAIANDTKYGFEFVPYLSAHAGWAEAMTGDFDTGIAEIAAGASVVRAAGGIMWQHVFAGLLADAHLTHGRFADALVHADGGLAQLRPTGARWFEAELHRLRGAALAGLDRADPRATDELRRAVAIASRQGAVALRRRAEASLAEVQLS